MIASIRVIVVVAVLSVALSVRAEPVVVFDASRDCQPAVTTLGLRFVPPCRLSPLSFELARPALPAAVASLPFKTVLDHRFSCASLRPVEAFYALTDPGAEPELLSLSPSARGSMRATFEGLSAPSFHFEGMDGLTGMQAFKPGCRWVVEQAVTYPSPSHAQLMVDGYLRLDAALYALIPALSPDADYLRARSALESTRSLLGFLLLMNSDDELLAASLGESLVALDSATLALSGSCGAGSSAELCSATLGTARDQLERLVDDTEGVLFALAESVALTAVMLDERGAAFDADRAVLLALQRRLWERLDGAALSN